MSTTAEADPNLGRTLDEQYRIDALIGYGGMGRVYRGLQLSVKREVAIKLITGTTPHQPEWEQRFRREAEATARLAHPNSVRLFDFGVTQARELYMVMELLQGMDLARHLAAHGPLQLSAALKISRQVLLALCEAHELGIVHRDLKPDNVFLSRVRGADTVAKVMDFGIAGIDHARNTGKITTTGAVIGTPAYMSPEQAQGQIVDLRSDLYSLGVMLFEMLSGRPPFEAETAVSLLLAHVTQPPPRLECSQIPRPQQAAVQALLDSLLAKQPQARPASASDTLVAIDALLEVQARRRPILPRLRFRLRRRSAERERKATRTNGDVSLAPTEHAARARERRGRGLGRLLLASGFLFALAGTLALLRHWRTPGPEAAAAAPSGGVELEQRVQRGAEHAPSTPQSNVLITSTPSGATLSSNGAELGKTPYRFQFKRATTLTVRRHGYEPQVIRVTPASDPTLMINLLREADPPDPRLAATETSESALTESDSDPRQRDEPSAPQPSAAEQPSTPQPQSGAATLAGTPQPTRAHRVRLAVGRFMDNLLGRNAVRARREALVNRPLAYPSFPALQRAYDQGQIDLERYEDLNWVLKEKRAQRVDAERDRLRRGAIDRTEYEVQLDRIAAEFRGD